MMYCPAIKDQDKRNSVLELDGIQIKKPMISQWFTPENDIFGYLERSEKVVNSIAQLLHNDSPVCHIHYFLIKAIIVASVMIELVCALNKHSF